MKRDREISLYSVAAASEFTPYVRVGYYIFAELIFYFYGQNG